MQFHQSLIIYASFLLLPSFTQARPFSLKSLFNRSTTPKSPKTPTPSSLHPSPHHPAKSILKTRPRTLQAPADSKIRFADSISLGKTYSSKEYDRRPRMEHIPGYKMVLIKRELDAFKAYEMPIAKESNHLTAFSKDANLPKEWYKQDHSSNKFY